MNVTTTLSATPPDGQRLCDFLPNESAVAALERKDFTSDGDVVRDPKGALSSAACRVSVPEQDVSLLAVNVVFSLGLGRAEFDRLLTSNRVTQLPDSAGLGYTWIDDVTLADGSTAKAAHCRLAFGNYLIEVDDRVPGRGRPAEADATAIAQQVAETLKIPERWTLRGDSPPSR